MMEEPMPGRKTSYFQGLQKMQKGYPAEIEKQMALSSSPSSMVSPSDDNDFSSTSSSVTISSDEPLSPDQALSDTSKADEPSWSSMISIDSYEKTVRLSDIKALLDPTTPASTRLNYLEEAHPLMEDILLEINELPDPQKQHATRKLMSLWDDIQQLAAPFEFVKEQAMRLHDLSAHFSQNHETLLTEVDNIHAAIVKTMAPYKDDPSYSPLVKKYVSWADERLSEMQSLLALAEGAKMLEGFNSQAPLHIDINSTDMLYNNRVYAAMLLLTHGTDISISSGNNIEPAASSDHEREKQAFIQKYLLDSIENIERDWVRTAITEGLSAFAAERGFDGDGMTFYQMQVAKVTSPGADTEEQPPSPSCMR